MYILTQDPLLHFSSSVIFRFLCLSYMFLVSSIEYLRGERRGDLREGLKESQLWLFFYLRVEREEMSRRRTVKSLTSFLYTF